MDSPTGSCHVAAENVPDFICFLRRSILVSAFQETGPKYQPTTPKVSIARTLSFAGRVCMHFSQCLRTGLVFFLFPETFSLQKDTLKISAQSCPLSIHIHISRFHIRNSARDVPFSQSQEFWANTRIMLRNVLPEVLSQTTLSPGPFAHFSPLASKSNFQRPLVFFNNPKRAPFLSGFSE